MKHIQLGENARKEAVEALKTIAKAVSTTLGPKGLPFIFEKQNAIDGKPTPMITKDGLQLLRSLSFVNAIEHSIHNFCVQASSHTVYTAGDGTTSTIVLAAKIAEEILNADAVRPQAFARIIQKQANAAIEAIKKDADLSPECARMVALTSSNGDEEMIDWVMKAVKDNPMFGSIIIERNPGCKENYQLIKQDGVTGGRGYNQFLQFAHSFSDKTAENAPFEIDAPLILLYDGDLITESQLAPLLNMLNTRLPKPWKLVILAYELGQEVTNTLAAINARNKGSVQIWASSIRLTAEVNCAWHKLQDVAAFTGSTPINHGTVSTETFAITNFGTCSKVIVTPEKTVFVGRNATQHWIPKRAVQNENAIELASTELDKERIKERNAELVSGLTKLVVGGGHLANLQERADRCDDAIKAAQACLSSGALPGCGASLIRAAALSNVGDELKRAFGCIHEAIMANYGVAPKDHFDKGQTLAITSDGIVEGNFKDLQLADSVESIVAVIRNAVELGILVSTLGGFSLTSDLDELEKIQRVRSIMGNM
jgi:chaperonin GroEL